EDCIRYATVTGVQTCALPILNVALLVHRNTGDAGKVSRSGPLLAPGLHELAVLIELRHAGIAQTIGDENVSRTIPGDVGGTVEEDRKSTRLNSSHGSISYAVF